MNILKYLTMFLILVSVTIFSTAAFLLVTKNNSVTTTDQNHNPIVLPDPVPETKKQIIKRSLNSQINNQTTNPEPEESEQIKSNLAHYYFDSDDIKDYSKEINKFVDEFEKELNNLIKTTNEENEIIGRINIQILKTHYSLLRKLTEKEIELETFIKNNKEHKNEFDKFIKEDLKKIYVNNPNYDIKHATKYLDFLRKEIKSFETLFNILKMSGKYLNEALKNINKMFEIFFYAYEFDIGKFNKYQLKDLVNNFNSKKFQNFFERIYFDDLIKNQNKRKQWLDEIYSNKLITEDFYLEVKGLFENIFELTSNIFKEVDLYAKVYESIMKRLGRFIEKMEMIVQEDDE